jgi:hypothetical protein
VNIQKTQTKLSANTKIARMALLSELSVGFVILCQNPLVVMPKLAVELGINKHCLDAKIVMIRSNAETISYAGNVRYRMRLFFIKFCSKKLTEI